MWHRWPFFQNQPSLFSSKTIRRKRRIVDPNHTTQHGRWRVRNTYWMNTTLHSVMDKYLAGFRKTCFVPLLTTIIIHLLYYYYYYYIFLIRHGLANGLAKSCHWIVLTTHNRFLPKCWKKVNSATSIRFLISACRKN